MFKDRPLIRVQDRKRALLAQSQANREILEPQFRRCQRWLAWFDVGVSFIRATRKAGRLFGSKRQNSDF